MSTAKKKIYEKVAEYIKTAIYNGEMQLGDAIYSENHLCNVLKVSRTSVRKAIRQMVEENILISRPGVGTFVKSVGHGVIHNSICLFNHYTRNLRFNSIDSYYSEMIYSAERTASANETNFQIFSRPLIREKDATSMTGYLKTDGIIVDGRYQGYFSNLDFLSKISPNLVVLDGHPEETVFPVVAPDLVEAYEELIDAAAEHGKTAIFLYSEYMPNCRWSALCFDRALKKNPKIKVEFVDFAQNVPQHLFNNIDHQYLIRSAIFDQLSGKLPGSIICSSDHTALHTFRLLQGMGLKVPEDIALSGTGGLGFTSMVDPNITTVRINPEKMAQTAVERLLKLINGETWTNGILCKAVMTRRQSL